VVKSVLTADEVMKARNEYWDKVESLVDPDKCEEGK